MKKAKDPGSALTHFIGMLMAIFAATPLLLKAAGNPDRIHLISLSIFIVSMILLYTASTVYHTFNLSPKGNKFLKRMDHMMIFILIAGSYTPICMIALEPSTGYPLLILVWGLAFIGILVKMFWIMCPKWVSSVLYIAMGWTCVLAFTQILNALPPAAFGWLLAGGIIYTAGGVIYAMKFQVFHARFQNFGSHELFHLFVMGGSFCHFICMFQYLATMPIG